MKYTEASQGRVFILRMEHGDKIPDLIEEFAQKQQVKSALVFWLGGADTGSRVVVGPEDGAVPKPIPMVTRLLGTSEALGLGTLFCDEKGYPKLHLHASFGRNREAITGCTRDGVDIWQIGEVIVLELINVAALRKVDPQTGFELLEVTDTPEAAKS